MEAPHAISFNFNMRVVPSTRAQACCACTTSTVPPHTHLLVVDAREVPHHDAPVGAARRENGLVLWAPANLREDRERGERGGACMGITKLPQLGEKGGVSHECQL